jgi:hypothetical protein
VGANAAPVTTDQRSLRSEDHKQAGVTAILAFAAAVL